MTKKNGMTIGLLLAGAALISLSGCTIETDQIKINTPAVYNVVTTNGVAQSNLVAAASVKTEVKKERLWLPEGYSLEEVNSGYGVHFAAIDKTSGNPGDIKAGIWYSDFRWTPSGTNPMYAPPITASGTFGNSLPFTLKGSVSYTAGQSQVQSGTNSAAGAIVPGVPVDQQK